jgi:hypothetical protein
MISLGHPVKGLARSRQRSARTPGLRNGAKTGVVLVDCFCSLGKYKQQNRQAIYSNFGFVIAY